MSDHWALYFAMAYNRLIDRFGPYRATNEAKAEADRLVEVEAEHAAQQD